MRPTVDALAKHHRVITFSLCDERTSPFPCDPEKAFENYVEQVDLALDRARARQGDDCRRVVRRVDRHRICGAPPAARRRPGARVGAAQDLARRIARSSSFLRAPRLMSPLFVATAPRRHAAGAGGGVSGRWRAAAFHGDARRLRGVWRSASPAKMARRIAWAHGASLRRVARRAGAGAGRHRRARARPGRAGRCHAAVSRRSAIGASTSC